MASTRQGAWEGTGVQLSLVLPKAVHRSVREFAKESGLSYNSAAAAWLSVLSGISFRESRKAIVDMVRDQTQGRSRLTLCGLTEVAHRLQRNTKTVFSAVRAKVTHFQVLLDRDGNEIYGQMKMPSGQWKRTSPKPAKSKQKSD